jgi:hypothetical protein
MTEQTTAASIPPSVEAMHADFLRDALTQRADGLRRIADAFDRLAKDVDSTASYSRIAAQALHELTWGVANLNVERLINEGAGADVARAKGE